MSAAASGNRSSMARTIFLSFDWMNTHLGPLVVSQWRGFFQDMIGYCYLADVMKAGAEFERNQIRPGHAKLLAETNAESDDAFGMTFSFLVSRIKRERERSSGSIPVVALVCV